MNKLEMLRRAVAAPWAIRRDYLPQVLAGLQRGAQEDEAPAEPEPMEPDDLVEGRIAVLPLTGILLQRPGLYFADGPVTYTELWGEVFDELVASPEVAGIVIDALTPGGIVYGTPELADKIYEARGTKPILAVSNALAASAGYWITTSADQLFVTPSGEVGSVGVYTMHMDWSKFLEDVGIDVTFIHAGEFKVEGNPFEPLGEEAREELQRYVDEAHDAFAQALARNRETDVETVLETFGRGRVITAATAVELGMADGVATLEQVVAEAARLAGVPPVPAVEGRGLDRARDVEVRALQTESRVEAERQLVGEGVPYGRESADMGGWREMFEPGAFSESAAEDDIRVIWQHDPGCVFGRTKVGTARVWEEGESVRYSAKPPDAQWARDALESIRRGDVDQSSFAFRVAKDGYRWVRRDGYDLRIVSRARIVELGPQTHPAYQDTSVAVQERAAWRRRLERRADDDLEREIELMEAEL